VGLSPPVTVVPATDTVDVPSFDVFDLLGHSCYAEAKGLLHDIFDLITRNPPPQSRLRLDRIEQEDGSFYWVISR
jgi:hypothetical protein